MATMQAVCENPCEVSEMERDDVYLPSREEIQSVCQEIQAGWTEAERARRARGQAGRVRTPMVTVRRYARLTFDRRHPVDERAA